MPLRYQAGQELLASGLSNRGSPFNRLESATHLRNGASWRFQESLGFVREGVMRQDKYIEGEYVDDVLYGMLRD